LDFLFNKGKYIDAKKPDLILLHINLPIFNGHEVVENIRDVPDLGKIPVIMLTNSSNPTDINLAFENRCFSYFVKPLDLDEFLEHILKIETFTLRLSTIAD